MHSFEGVEYLYKMLVLIQMPHLEGDFVWYFSINQIPGFGIQNRESQLSQDQYHI
jgi:hypothetical protein